MPGLVKMEHQAAPEPPDLKKERGHAQTQQANAVQPATSVSVHAQVNGNSRHAEQDTLSNGAPLTNGDALGATRALATDMAMEDSDRVEPPILDQSWRTSEHNKSLGKLMDRLAQQCYIDLNSTLTQMAELGAPEGNAVPQANGILSHDQPDRSETSMRKKRMFMEFAHDQRDRFTKALVLSDYSRNEADMAKLIDIKIWQDQQRFAYRSTLEALAVTKRKMLDFKVPAPNVEGAMELLATGKASWVPDLGYIPPSRLTAKQLLKTLRNMNVALATRLNLHEEIPVQMRDYSVADGRATFRVAGAFEVDLSVADEEPTSPWYFIDMRFLFSPSSDTLNDQIRIHLEPRVNDALAKKGLQGCYDFLNNFVLTHKINILRNQAQELLRTKWFDCIAVESMRRTLIVQYWSGMPGPKNWFEVGIKSGKPKAGSHQASSPSLSVRWFRMGMEVSDELLDFDWQKLDLQACLMQVIAIHTFGKLSAARDNLLSLRDQCAPGTTALDTKMSSSDATSEECSLSLRLPSLSAPLTVSIEPTTGRVALSPPNAIASREEGTFNARPHVDLARVLRTCLTSSVQEHYRRQASLANWTELHDIAAVKPNLGPDVWQRSIYAIPGWGKLWGIAVTFGLGAAKWWVVTFKQSSTQDAPDAFVAEVETAHQLPITAVTAAASHITQETLLHVERVAVAHVSYTVLSQQLQARRIPHHLEKSLTGSEESRSRLKRPYSSAFVDFDALMSDGAETSHNAWARKAMRISHHGVEERRETDAVKSQRVPVRHDLRLCLAKDKTINLQRCATTMQDKDVAVNAKNGGLAISLRTPFGEPFVDQIRTGLSTVARLDNYVETLRKLHLNCTLASLARLDFTYCKSPQLDAHLTFGNDGSLPIRLKLLPADSNPHLRVATALERALNSNGKGAFAHFAQVLLLTLPLLQALDRLEVAHLTPKSLFVHARNAGWFQLNYKAPFAMCVFSIKARTRLRRGQDKPYWHLELQATPAKEVGLPDGFADALKQLWQDKGNDWLGLGDGIVAGAAGIATALEKADELVRKFPQPIVKTNKPPENPDGEKAAQSNDVKREATQTAPTAEPQPKQEPDVIMLD